MSSEKATLENLAVSKLDFLRKEKKIAYQKSFSARYVAQTYEDHLTSPLRDGRRKKKRSQGCYLERKRGKKVVLESGDQFKILNNTKKRFL